MNRVSTMGGAVACGAIISIFSSATASAAENISGDVGLSNTSPFLSSGADFGGGGSHFYGDRATTFLWGDLAVKATDSLTFTLTLWSDINDNTVSGIGGHIQEVDFDPGFTYTMGKVTFGA